MGHIPNDLIHGRNAQPGLRHMSVMTYVTFGTGQWWLGHPERSMGRNLKWNTVGEGISFPKGPLTMFLFSTILTG